MGFEVPGLGLRIWGLGFQLLIQGGLLQKRLSGKSVGWGYDIMRLSRKTALFWSELPLRFACLVSRIMLSLSWGTADDACRLDVRLRLSALEMILGELSGSQKRPIRSSLNPQPPVRSDKLCLRNTRKISRLDT